MWSVANLCRCTSSVRVARTKLSVPATRNSLTISNAVSRQLFTGARFNNGHKGLRLSSLARSNGLVLRFCSTSPKPRNTKLVGYWLLGCSGMVFTAVVLGGVTRLTESGLSMVTWKLLGEKLPSSEAEWEREFAEYQQYPEFKYKNQNITLSEFKWIWYMEFAHRTWGRCIGAAMFIPAAFFWARGYLDKGMKVRVGAYCALVAAQGLMGWYMVKSGLEDRFQGPSDVPRVSQYRLAAHLSLAFLLYTGLLGGALRVLRPFPVGGTLQKFKELKSITALAHSVKAMAFFTAISGAFVAGLDAGLVYNSFPKMGDRWLPDDILAFKPTARNFTENPTTVQFDHSLSTGMETFVAGLDAGLVYNSFPKMGDRWLPDDILTFKPTARNFTENPTTVQFDHRVLGTTTLALATALWILSRRKPLTPAARRVVNAVGAMAWLQVSLGILTLLHYVPTPLAASHQSGSLVLLTLAIWLTHEIKLLKYIPK